MRIQAQRDRIASLETALWDGGLNEPVLASYQAACRELEDMLAARPEDRRHHFVIVIPVADSPGHLANCLASLHTLCRTYGYGGLQRGRYRKVSVLLADDSADAAAIEGNRTLLREFRLSGIDTHYFGIREQQALLRRLEAVDLGPVIGEHASHAFAHKGQAMMRNIAYLKLAELQSQMPGQRLLFYTVDSDQEFRVKVATPVKQQQDFADIVAFAASHTDFYAARFGSRDLGRDRPLRSQELPVLEKQDVISYRDALLVRGADRERVKLGHTGGSTGRPLAFYFDDAKHELMLAGMMRGFMMSGWRPGQKILYFWGASRDLAPGGVFGGSQGERFRGEKAVSAIEFSEARLYQWAQLIRRWRPKLLYGYASALSELAGFVIEEGIALPGPLLGVYSTAEVLNDWQRERMQRAFGCRVFNQYGCREVPNIAWECRHGGMHVFTDMVYLESLPAADENRLLVTSLTNRLMPFIRYDLGDSGRLLDTECGCGLPFPLMEMGVCRQNDMIRTSAGKRFHPAYFNRLLYGLQQIRQYQWVQTGLDRVALNLVAEERLSAQVLASLIASIRRDVDERMQLEVSYVDEIPRTGSGKHRFVIGLADSRGQSV